MENCKLCTQVQKHLVDEEEEINPFAKKTEFSMNCQDPTDFIPVYRRIHEFAEKGKNDQVLVINLKKNFELTIDDNDNDHTTERTGNVSSVIKRAACDTVDSLLETTKAKKNRTSTLIPKTFSMFGKHERMMSNNSERFINHGEPSETVEPDVTLMQLQSKSPMYPTGKGVLSFLENNLESETNFGNALENSYYTKKNTNVKFENPPSSPFSDSCSPKKKFNKNCLPKTSTPVKILFSDNCDSLIS